MPVHAYTLLSPGPELDGVRLWRGGPRYRTVFDMAHVCGIKLEVPYELVVRHGYHAWRIEDGQWLRQVRDMAEAEAILAAAERDAERKFGREKQAFAIYALDPRNREVTLHAAWKHIARIVLQTWHKSVWDMTISGIKRRRVRLYHRLKGRGMSIAAGIAECPAWTNCGNPAWRDDTIMRMALHLNEHVHALDIAAARYAHALTALALLSARTQASFESYRRMCGKRHTRYETPRMPHDIRLMDIETERRRYESCITALAMAESDYNKRMEAGHDDDGCDG